jgi:aryl-alcohol dehydrogenase-like predicted oxidoreductase
MEYRTFGSTGWRVSAVGFGAWAIGGDMWGPQDDRDSEAALRRAIERGVNFIDTAQGYGKGHSEEVIGRVLRDVPEEIFVATKVPPARQPWPPPPDADADAFYPADYIVRAAEDSLGRLGRETIDVYQFHSWASAFNVEGAWFEAMSRLKEQGKIRAIGVSVPDNTPENVIGALALGKVDSVQVIYNVFEQVPVWNLFPACDRLGTGTVIRVPFDEGALTGKYTASTRFPAGDVRGHYFRGRNLPAVVERVEALRTFKNLRHPEMPLAEYALRFALSHPAVHTVIPGMRTPAQVDMNTLAADGRLLDPDELRELRRFAWRKDFWNEEADGPAVPEHQPT